jgi:hypothetical protein
MSKGVPLFLALCFFFCISYSLWLCKIVATYFLMHYTYLPLLPGIKYSISCAMPHSSCDSLPALCKNSCSFWSCPYMQQHSIIHFYFNTKVYEIKTPSVVQVRHLNHYIACCCLRFHNYFPRVQSATRICRTHLPSWLLSEIFCSEPPSLLFTSVKCYYLLTSFPYKPEYGHHLF